MENVLRSFAYSVEYLGDLVSELSRDQMVCQPHGVNIHPAWIIGHLTYSCQAIGGEFGLGPWLPAEWAEQFGTGSVPLGDSATYPAMSESLHFLVDAKARVSSAIRNLESAQLDQPLLDKRFRQMMPTIRDAITQILVSHAAYHIGQVVIWRRLMGFAPVERPFL